MRGDPVITSFSAYPGVRTKGTKNKIGITRSIRRSQGKRKGTHGTTNVKQMGGS